MIETDRLVLTVPTIADFDAFHAMLCQAAVYPFLGGSPSARPESWMRLLRSIGHWTAYGYGLFSVREKATGDYMGETGIAHFERGLGSDFDPCPEGAWVLAGESHGKGYATEAASAAHRWFFGLKGEQRGVCMIDPDNRGSIRVAGKLGYVSFAERDYRGKTIRLFERLPTTVDASAHHQVA